MQGTAGSNGQLCLQTSDELIEIYRRTHSAADFEQIVRRFSAMVLSESRRVTGNAHDAEDASQLAFLALAIEIRSGTNIRRVGPWLQRVAKRKAMKIVRSRGRRKRREDAARRSELQTLDLGSAMDSTFAAGLVRDAIDELPERYRLPIVLHYFGGMSLELIAGELKVSRQAVGTRLHRARKMLAGGLRRHGVHLKDLRLNLAMSAIVPAAVIDHILRSAAPMQISTSALSLPASVSRTLSAASVFSTPRLVRIAAVAAALACGGSATAWVQTHWPALRQMRPVDAIQWLQRLIPVRPQFSAAATIERQIDAPPTSLPNISNDPREVFAARPLEQWPVHIELFAPVSSVDSERGSGLPVAPAARPAAPVAARWNGGSNSGSGDRALPLNLARGGTNFTSASSGASAVAKPQAAAAAVRAAPVGSERPREIGSVALGDALGALPARMSLGAGAYDASRVDVGRRGAGMLAIGPHAQLNSTQLRIGVEPFANGSVVQDGGRVNSRQVIVGDAGVGTYQLHAGELHAGSVTLGHEPKSTGELHVDAAEVVVTDPAGAVTVGDKGAGKLVLGGHDRPGTIRSADAAAGVPLIVRASADAQGTVEGWGTLVTGGALVNNGKVIADGFDQPRSLDFSGAAAVVNTIDNPPNGANGWYVRRGGRIQLPAIAIASGAGTYTWGESPDDPTLDLVNSLRFSVADQPMPALVSITYQSGAASAGGRAGQSLPHATPLVGLWQFDGENFDPGHVTVSVRYDRNATNSLYTGPATLDLLAYNGQWDHADALWFDRANYEIGGDFSGKVKLVALGLMYPTLPARVDTMSDAVTTAALISHASSIVPEPATTALLFPAAAAVLLRRRARRA